MKVFCRGTICPSQHILIVVPGVTWLISRRLDATCALVLSDPAGRLCVVDVTIKDKVFQLIGQTLCCGRYHKG